MPQAVSWYYKPVSSHLYPGVSPRDVFIDNTLREETSRRRAPDVVSETVTSFERSTRASTQRNYLPRLTYHFTTRYETEGGRHVWTNLQVMNDAYRCMWTKSGSLRLPNVLSCRGGV